MKCINNQQEENNIKLDDCIIEDSSEDTNQVDQHKKRKFKQRIKAFLLGILFICLALFLGVGGFILLELQNPDKTQVLAYETSHLNKNLYQGEFYAENLCVTTGNTALEGFPGDSELHAAGLFNLKNQQVLYGDKLFDKLYPASTTKIMTALIVLKYGNLEDIVTVSENALKLEKEATVCELEVGDTLSLYDLLRGLLIQSGNDSAIAIAEHMYGSVEAFAEKMNEEARFIGATKTKFVNPHGLHDENHYTTAYDLYLMFNECLKFDAFKEIISMKNYVATVTAADGNSRGIAWYASNYYAAERVPVPEGVNMIGGKTGTTDEAGACVILYSQNAVGTPFISIVMGAKDKDILYNDMSALLTIGVPVKSE